MPEGGIDQSGPTGLMNKTNPNCKMRDLAQRLLAYEAALTSSEENTSEVFRVSEKLRRSLSTLAGAAGFRTLLARALALTKAHAPCLTAVQVKPDGSLEGLSNLDDGGEVAEAGALLIAQLLGLLVVFIGENLVLRLVLDVWPDLPAHGSEIHRESET